MKKNLLNKLLKNKIVYYVVLALAALNVLGYFSMRSWECVVLFSAVAYSANCYCGNMTVSLLAGLFVSNFDFYLEDNYFAIENSRKPLLHTWSLSLEAQIYLLFLLLFLLFFSAKINFNKIINILDKIKPAEGRLNIFNKDKKIVSGDPEKIKKIYDTWVFSRDTSTNNPNWQLIDTLS